MRANNDGSSALGTVCARLIVGILLDQSWFIAEFFGTYSDRLTASRSMRVPDDPVPTFAYRMDRGEAVMGPWPSRLLCTWNAELKLRLSAPTGTHQSDSSLPRLI